jgi:adenylyltransferase/sulfurtransferase
MIVIRIPTPLRPYAGGEKEVQVAAATVGEALEHLSQKHPALTQHLYDEEGALRPYVNIFVNEDDVRDLQTQETPLTEGDRIMILPSIAGGLG